VGGSYPRNLTYLRKFLWYARERGLGHAFGQVFAKTRSVFRRTGEETSTSPKPAYQLATGEGLPSPPKKQFTPEEVLDLQPGELVEVKSEEEILATLDQQGKQRGLSWMPSMRKFCGQRFRVFKRLGPIVLESTGEFRDIKNTVLLEGVLCDGDGFFGCTRSCFHFWREAWLRRVEE
jgi:hypothetical protein